jgi:hypothetical protein
MTTALFIAGSGSLPSDHRSMNIHDQFLKKILCYGCGSNNHEDYDNSGYVPGFQF